ncbi:MAG: hypothetical protein FWH18_04435 [Marinilabiliaceae bacterium]|nr:hypothetical protein [Marinilabiliaceae bacterium]
MKNSILIISVLSLLFFSCSEDLDRTIFIPDENDSSLPAYSEWGYNSFGAEFDRLYFLASQNIVPCKIKYENDSLYFSLHGIVNDYDLENNRMILEFIFPFEKIENFTELIKLNDLNINLLPDYCKVVLDFDNTKTIVDVLSGKLHFKRTQLLFVDDSINRVIISGVFDIRFRQNGYLSNISNGRFDVGINHRYFLNAQIE